MSCPDYLKKALKRAVDFTCEECGVVFKENQLEIHRIKQGYLGGKYIGRNCKVVCSECHKMYAEEW